MRNDTGVPPHEVSLATNDVSENENDVSVVDFLQHQLQTLEEIPGILEVDLSERLDVGIFNYMIKNTRSRESETVAPNKHRHE